MHIWYGMLCNVMYGMYGMYVYICMYMYVCMYV